MAAGAHVHGADGDEMASHRDSMESLPSLPTPASVNTVRSGVIMRMRWLHESATMMLPLASVVTSAG